jgi:pimeloyl-ACP methyl ester carboxylesterase
MPVAHVNGLALHYELHGTSGEPLVFVHGYTGALSDWRHQVPFFSKSYRVLTIDNRGSGSSEAPADRAAYTVDAMAADAEALIEHAGFDRYHLAGHSMGGAIAQEIALRNTSRLLSLTLADTTFWAGDHEDGTGTPPYITLELAEESRNIVARMSQDALAGLWTAWIGWRGTADRAQDIAVPTLVIYGSRDASKIIDGSQRLLDMLSNARVVVIDGAGHSPHLERPTEYNAVLADHLRGAYLRASVATS